jgi:hypothetical protein
MSTPSTNSVQLDALLKLFGLCESTEAAPWIKDYLYMKFPAGTESLVNYSDEELQAVITDLISKYTDENLPIPDVLFNFDGITNSVSTEDENGKEGVTDLDSVIDQAGNSVNENDKQDELDINLLNKKLEVAKGFVQDLDQKNQKFESEIKQLREEKTQLENQLTIKTDLVSKYESLGTPEELGDLKSSYVELQSKFESTSSELEQKESDAAKTSSDENLKAESEKTEEDSNTMSSEDKDVLLKKYQELGTVEELAAFKKSCEDKNDDKKNSDEDEEQKQKDEAFQAMEAQLAKYTAIGEPEEIQALVDRVYEEKMESESTRLATKYNMTVEKARESIDKFESVAELEEFLDGFLPKVESTDDNEKTEDETKQKSESAEEDQVSHDQKQKDESAESTTKVEDEANKDKHEGLSPERAEKLSSIMLKI